MKYAQFLTQDLLHYKVHKHNSGFTPVFSNPVATSTQQPESQSSATGSQDAKPWTAAAEEFLRHGEKLV